MKANTAIPSSAHANSPIKLCHINNCIAEQTMNEEVGVGQKEDSTMPSCQLLKTSFGFDTATITKQQLEYVKIVKKTNLLETT